VCSIAWQHEKFIGGNRSRTLIFYTSFIGKSHQISEWTALWRNIDAWSIEGCVIGCQKLWRYVARVVWIATIYGHHQIFLALKEIERKN
jgi:hypothetical protein